MRSREPNRRRDCSLNVALYKEELEHLRQATSNSTCRSLSEYCRKLLLGKPVRTFYRDQSFDAFIEEAIALRNEMQAEWDKGPFTPEGERRLITLQEEIKKCINKIFDYVTQNKKEPGNGCNPGIQRGEAGSR